MTTLLFYSGLLINHFNGPAQMNAPPNKHTDSQFPENDPPNFTPDDAEFRTRIAYYWVKYQDPEKYAYYTALRCASLMPEFFSVWNEIKLRKSIIERILNIR